MQNENGEKVLTKFDRIYGGLLGGNNLHTRPATIEEVEHITGETETFIVQTVRDEKGDHLVIKFIDGDGVKRIILPPRVTNLIASHRDSLTTRRRSLLSKAAAKARMDRGEQPAFLRNPPARKKRKAKAKLIVKPVAAEETAARPN